MFGFQLNVPIFEGFGRSYRIRQAKSQSEVEEASLDDLIRSKKGELWTNYTNFGSLTENLANVDQLLKISEESYNAAFKRYLIGVGNILELISSQNALANAKSQQISAITEWNVAKLELSVSLGRLGKGL